MGKFCSDHDLDISHLGSLISMRITPIITDGGAQDVGEFRVIARRLMEALGAAPSDLWTDDQLYGKLKRNSASITVGAEDFKALLLQHESARLEAPAPDDEVDRGIVAAMVHSVLEQLTPKERQVLEMRNGIGHEEMTLDEVGRMIGTTRERVRQIEAKALRKLKEPSRKDVLRKLL